MEVSFAKTGARRYGVVVQRQRAPNLVMDPDRWHSLGVGEELTLEWPIPERR